MFDHSISPHQKQINPTQAAVDPSPYSTGNIANHQQLTGDSFPPEFKPPNIELERCCRHCECSWGSLDLNFQIFCLACDQPLRWIDPGTWLIRSDLWSAEAIREGALR